ncbi:hypothetical protein KFE98_15065 [bacterium SCSIO 12741]|nr:hypothetical protein KFE98_15065 [bacterium SCSIO 12741]
MHAPGYSRKFESRSVAHNGHSRSGGMTMTPRQKSFEQSILQMVPKGPVVQLEGGDKDEPDLRSVNRTTLDLVGNLYGTAQDIGKKKHVTGIGKAVKSTGSMAKLLAAEGKAGQIKISKEEINTYSGFGTNLKTTGGDIVEFGETWGNKKASKTKKAATGIRALSSIGGTTAEALHQFGFQDEVTMGEYTLVADSAKLFTYAHDFYEVIAKVWSECKNGNVGSAVWKGTLAFFQKLGSASLTAPRLLSVWDRIKGDKTGEKGYLKLMPLGRALMNLSTALDKTKIVHSDYKSYQQIEALVKSYGKKKNSSAQNLMLLFNIKWDQLVKNTVGAFVGIGETVYWAGKYFPAISGISLTVGVYSKMLKVASSLFSSLGIRQMARDYIPFESLVNKDLRSDKIGYNRAELVRFYTHGLQDKNHPFNKNNESENLLKIAGLKKEDTKDKEKVKAAVAKLI